MKGLASFPSVLRPLRAVEILVEKHFDLKAAYLRRRWRKRLAKKPFKLAVLPGERVHKTFLRSAVDGMPECMFVGALGSQNIYDRSQDLPRGFELCAYPGRNISVVLFQGAFGHGWGSFWESSRTGSGEGLA